MAGEEGFEPSAYGFGDRRVDCDLPSNYWYFWHMLCENVPIMYHCIYSAQLVRAISQIRTIQKFNQCNFLDLTPIWFGVLIADKLHSIIFKMVLLDKIYNFFSCHRIVLN